MFQSSFLIFFLNKQLFQFQSMSVLSACLYAFPNLSSFTPPVYGNRPALFYRVAVVVEGGDGKN